MSKPATSALRVMIADDEAVIRMGLKVMVQSLGHRVVATASDGDEALDTARNVKPDLLLLDIKMPGLDGLAVAEQLMAEIPLPIVMLTAYSQRELVQRAVNASVMGYLVKPIREEALRPTLELALSRFEAASAIRAESASLRERIETRELIEEAKALLMDQGLGENEAYHRLQSAARRRRVTLRQLAERIIAARGWIDPDNL